MDIKRPKWSSLAPNGLGSAAGGDVDQVAWKNKGQEAPPAYRELGLSNLYAGDPFNSLCGYYVCAFFILPSRRPLSAVLAMPF